MLGWVLFHPLGAQAHAVEHQAEHAIRSSQLGPNKNGRLG